MRSSTALIIDRIALVAAALCFLGTIILLSYACKKIYVHVPMTLQRNDVIDQVLQYMFLAIMFSNLGDLIPKRFSAPHALAKKHIPLISVSTGIVFSLIAIYRSGHILINLGLSVAYLAIFAVLFVTPVLAILIPAKLSDYLKNSGSVSA